MNPYYDATIFFPISWEMSDVIRWEIARIGSFWKTTERLDMKTGQLSLDVKIQTP